ncbi:MAG: zeta-carotene-forming phytoene desaturase [candidate division BRC1 bacterium ADurb.BinA364]|nr:MAG: zeta-carotene-forming phytoene desaturase [candidate division BRC1 bacterium ADurb.BinA364]
MRFLADAQRKYRLAFDKLACRNASSVWDWIRPLTPAEAWNSGIWRSLDGELRRFFRSPRIREAFGSYAMYLGGSPYRLPGLFSILAYGELAQGLWLPRGGIHALARAIESLAAGLGVRILTGHRVRRILVADSAVTGAELEDGRLFESPVIVSNVDAPSTERRLLGRTGGAARAVRMTPSVMTLYWGMRRKPAGASHHTIFLPRDARRNYDSLIGRGRIPEELPFYMSIATETDPSLAPEGHSAIFLLVPLPLLSDLESWNMDELAGHLKSRILERLARHGIALERENLLVERTLSPADWAERFGLHDGSAFGAAHTLFQMGPFRFPNRDPAVRGLYYAGASTTPGTGLPMVALGGEMTAERILHDLP